MDDLPDIRHGNAEFFADIGPTGIIVDPVNIGDNPSSFGQRRQDHRGHHLVAFATAHEAGIGVDRHGLTPGTEYGG